MRVGSIVRVPLHGRRVRGWVTGWVVAGDDPPVDGLLDVLAVVSEGPPAVVVELGEWVAERWCGPAVAVLRSASPPNNVAPRTASLLPPPSGRTNSAAVVRRPPLHDRRAEVADLCASDGSTIVCVADAGRSRSLASYLRNAGRTVALMHSFESDAERTRSWELAARGGCVVVGGRISVFAPVPDLRAAVVVDDADEALQEERSPTWHARDVLRERARRAGAPFTVFSPAPTVEAIVDVGRARGVDAPSPDVERAGWPRVEIVDRREEPPGSGLLSEALANALHHAGGLAVCVLNRRGRFRLLVCGACAHLLRWDKPDERPLVCPDCGATKLRVLRAGVTRVREELEALVPGARVVDVDAATEDVPGSDIVVGTEAVLHRAEVRRARPALVAYLDLDQELLAPRYRAAAQAHWLLTRGAQLLAGRPRHETLMLLQTRISEHVVVQAVARGEPALVAESEIEYRRVLGYPPFGALAELSGADAAVAAAVDALRALDVQSEGVQVFGPADGKALVNAPEWTALSRALRRALPVGRAAGRLRAAVDPPRV